MELANIRQKKKKHTRLHLIPKGNISQGCILYCQQCDDSTSHFPVKRFMRQWNNTYIPTDDKTSKRSIMLKCNQCGNEVQNIGSMRHAFKNMHIRKRWKKP